MSYQGLYGKLARITGHKYPEIQKIIEKAIKENNIPLLEELVRFFNNIESKMNDLERKARTGPHFY